MSATNPWGPVDRLVGRADALAGAWGARARGSTTIGQERAILRLFGVQGLDRSGRPLAGSTVARWLASDPGGLSGGITLPFAMALLEYDLEAPQLALDVASGAVDLALEAELLREPDRRAVAETEAIRLATASLERIDAQRTVRRETMAVLGDAARPWLATTVRDPDVEGALEEAADLIEAGVDLLRIEVPIGRELVERLIDAGRDVPEWRPRDRPDVERRDPAPTGSQRALAQLRTAVDQAAAERRAYVRLGMVVPALGAPEGSVVAAFERIDLIASDVMAEIVADGVEPDRALADHAFAHRLARRAGTSVLVGSGPLVVAPDLRAGVPSDPATRAGRALALQLLGVTLARTDGLPADQIVIGALPPWLTDEPSPAARAMAEVAVRRALFPDHPIAFVEPPGGVERSVLWSFVQACGRGPRRGHGAGAAVLGPPPRRRRHDRRARPGRRRGGRGRGRVDDARRADRDRAGPRPRHDRGGHGHPRSAGQRRLAGGGRRSADRARRSLARGRHRDRAERAVRPVRLGADRQGLAVDRLAVDQRSPPDTAGITCTTDPAPDGRRQVARLAVDEHVDVRPEPRAGLDEPVAEPGHGRVERRR